MNRLIAKDKMCRLNNLVKTCNRLRKKEWHIRLMEDIDDNETERMYLKKEMHKANVKYRLYRARVIQYITLYNQRANWFQKISIDHFVEREM